MSELDKLIEAVEAGTLDTPCVEGVFAEPFFTTESGDFYKAAKVHAAYHGSLDAALALHEALLPGWDYNLAQGYARVFPEREGGDQEASTHGFGTPARAWLLAILRAYRSMQQ